MSHHPVWLLKSLWTHWAPTMWAISFGSPDVLEPTTKMGLLWQLHADITTNIHSCTTFMAMTIMLLKIMNKLLINSDQNIKMFNVSFATSILGSPSKTETSLPIPIDTETTYIWTMNCWLGSDDTPVENLADHRRRHLLEQGGTQSQHPGHHPLYCRHELR